MSSKRAVLLGLLTLLVGFSVFQVTAVPGLYQYAVLMPRAETSDDTKQPGDGDEQEGDPTPAPSAISLRIKSLTDAFAAQDDMVKGWSITAYITAQQLQESNGNTVTARLVGLWGDTHIQPAPVLRTGRLPYREDLDAGTRVAVVDERLAIELFRVSDPVGRLMQIGGVDFEVIGVVAHRRTPGEHEAFSAYVPLLAIGKLEAPNQVLVVSLQPASGAGGFPALRNAMENWMPGGEMYSLTKETYRALLPVRFLLVFVGVYLLTILFRLASRLSARMIAYGRRKLVNRYVTSLLPLFLGIGLAIIVFYGALLALTYLVFNQAIDPVYVFPEWVPVVPVEWTEIGKTFWANVTAQTKLLSVRTPETLALTFWLKVLPFVCGLAAFLLIEPLRRLKNVWTGTPSEQV